MDTTGSNCGLGGAYPCDLHVNLTAPNVTSFFDVFANVSFDGFWGTGDCSNDAIVFNAPVDAPEPLTLSLFGVGLLGLSAVRRRKLSKAA